MEELDQQSICPTCGAVGTRRWATLAGTDVCDECWLDVGANEAKNWKPPVSPHRTRYRLPRRPPTKPHSFCLICATWYYDQLVERCLKCGGLCRQYTNLRLLERKSTAIEVPPDAEIDALPPVPPPHKRRSSRRPQANMLALSSPQMESAAGTALGTGGTPEVQVAPAPNGAEVGVADPWRPTLPILLLPLGPGEAVQEQTTDKGAS